MILSDSTHIEVIRDGARWQVNVSGPVTPGRLVSPKDPAEADAIAAIFTRVAADWRADLAAAKKSATEKNYFAILGLDSTATKADIRKAKRRLSREHHPDLQQTAAKKHAAEEKMKAINEAYEVLTRKEKTA